MALLVLVTTLALIAGPIAPVSASVLPAPLYVPLTSNTSFGERPVDTTLVHITVTLRAGEKRRVFGRLEATSNRTPGEWLATAVRCLDPAGNQSGVAAWTGTNHEGADGPYIPKGHLVLYPSLLFTAPSEGTYRCELIVDTSGDHLDPLYHVTALRAGPDPGFGGTWLQVSSSDETGAQWWQNPDCDSDGTEPTCSYIGGSARQELRIFQNDGTPPELWTAAPNATAASVSATVEVTVCYHQTSSCTDNHEGGTGGATVMTHLELDQLGPGLAVCQVTKTPDVIIPLDARGHHHSISLEVGNAPISATCGGSRLFAVTVYLKQVSGNPVKIDGSRPEEHEAQTDAFAFNSAFDTTTTVPDVLGSSQTAATQAIAAAGLSVGTVSHVVDPAPPGTVISQNSPAGTVEPRHSPVDLTVSLGAATVPDVLSLTQSEAVAEIHAAGLAVGIGSIDPGTVQTQHPAGGTTVAARSAVRITISTCNGGGHPR